MCMLIAEPRRLQSGGPSGCCDKRPIKHVNVTPVVGDSPNVSGGRECVYTTQVPVAGTHTGRVPTRAPVEAAKVPRTSARKAGSQCESSLPVAGAASMNDAVSCTNVTSDTTDDVSDIVFHGMHEKRATIFAEHLYDDVDFSLIFHGENDTMQNDGMSVKGSLKVHLDWWIENAHSLKVLNIIKNGYALPLKNIPDAVFLNNNRSALSNMSFVMDSINDLLCGNRIQRRYTRPLVVNPLTVAGKSGEKQRLVLDLREVNRHIFKTTFAMEDLKTAIQIFYPNYVMFKCDLKAGYHHIDILEEHQQYLGFSVKINNIDCFYTFSVLPFGLSSAGFVFTEVVRSACIAMRKRGLKVIFYLDDALCVCRDEREATQQAGIFVDILKSAGFIINYEKSCFIPSHTIIWLGLQINLTEGYIGVPVEKLKAIMIHLRDINLNKKLTFRRMASIVGKLCALHLALGDVVYLKTKYMQKAITTANYWDETTHLNVKVKEELVFWRNNLFKLKFCDLFSAVLYDTECFTDASDKQGGGFIQGKGHEQYICVFTDEVRLASSTYREIFVVCGFLNNFVEQFKGRCVCVYTDNSAVTYIARRGSMHSELQDIAVNMHDLCFKNDIKLTVRWIPRKQNVLADKLSRVVLEDDWSISDHIFRLCDKRWGPFDIDLFASHYNTKCKVYYAKHYDAGAAGTDAIKMDWNGKNLWVVPPIELIIAFVRQVKKSRCKGVLVIPVWKNALFWSEITSEGQLIKIFYSHLLFSNPRGFFVKGSSDTSVFAKERFPGNVLIAAFDTNKM